MSRKWHKGPPPHVGWWNASFMKSHDCWRWWNGFFWSEPAWPEYAAKYAQMAAKKKQETNSHPIQWTHYYPKNARVPRIDPRKVK